MSSVRITLRALRNAPGPTVVVVGALAVAIAAASVVYTTIDMVLHMLPIADRDRMVFVASTDGRQGDATRLGLSLPDLMDVARQTTTIEEVAAFTLGSATLTGAGMPVRVSTVQASANLPSMWGLRPAAGRLFIAADARTGADRVAVLTDPFWRLQFASDVSIIGRTVLLDDEPHTVVGILAPAASVGAFRQTDMLVPMPLDASGAARDERDVLVTARLRPGTSQEMADVEAAAVSTRLERTYPQTNSQVRVRVLPLIELSGFNVRFLIFVLALIAVLVVAIACANVTNVILAQATTRRHERALRAALGASRLQQIRQLMTESFITSAAAGAGGIVLATIGLAALRWFAGAESIGFSDLRVNARVIAVGMLTSLAAPFGFALLPAIRASRIDHSELAGGGRSGTTSIRGRRIRNLVVAAQVALVVVLLIQVSLTVRGAWELSTRSQGFDPQNVLTFRLELPASLEQPETRLQFFQSLLGSIRALTPVVSAGAVDRLPVADEEIRLPFAVAGEPLRPTSELPLVARAAITPGYLGALRIPILKGRDLSEVDVATGAAVALVNEEAARRFWGTRPPLSTRITFRPPAGPSQSFIVVGVVGNVRNSDADQMMLPQVYVPAALAPERAMAFVVRVADGDPTRLTSSIRAEVARLDPNQPIHDVATMDEVVFNDLTSTYVLILLFFGVAAVAVCLAAAGIYGVVSYSVTQRTREIGVRMALGARPAIVQRMVIGEGSLPVIVGTLVGLPAAVAIAFATAGSITGVDVRDPVNYVAVTAGLGLVALMASYVPARGASRVDPAVTLRSE